MTLVIGTDEAGYGPNLGPLVVAASAWRVAADPDHAEAVLDGALVAAARAADPAAGATRPLWSDSKTIYRGGGRNATRGLAALEAGVLTAIAMATGRMPDGWDALAAVLGIAADPAPPPEWPALTATPLPLALDIPTCMPRTGRILESLARAGVSLDRIACRLVHPRHFNALLDAGLNKSDILSQVTLGLAADLRRAVDAPAVIWCDRHGGRKHYAMLVSRHFECPLVSPIVETAERSAYHLPSARCRIEFSVGGEDRAPVALASMTAKYVRELSMQAFNAFWSARAPGLAPTAGYPVDAARWRHAAAAAVAAAGIHDDDLWRRA
ncbi:MAG: hypothetical protein ACKOEX_09335 [Planctomycetia bacterium]